MEIYYFTTSYLFGFLVTTCHSVQAFFNVVFSWLSVDLYPSSLIFVLTVHSLLSSFSPSLSFYMFIFRYLVFHLHHFVVCSSV